MFSQILQYSHKKLKCQTLFLTKLWRFSLQKRDSETDVFPWILRNFQFVFLLKSLQQITSGRLLCYFASFSEILLKKLFEWFSSISETVAQTYSLNRSAVAIAISILLSKNSQIPSMPSAAWSSSEKICLLSKRPARYCWRIPKILWKRSV